MAAPSRMLEVRELLDEAKSNLRRIQQQQANPNLCDRHGRRLTWHEAAIRKNDLRIEFEKAVDVANLLKAELRKLSEATGGDPRWKLIRDAYRAITRLDEAGVEIGEDGRAFLDSAEFHCPMAQLMPRDGEEPGS